MEYQTPLRNVDLLRKRIIAMLFSDLAVDLFPYLKRSQLRQIQGTDLIIVRLFYMSEQELKRYYEELRNA